MMNLLEETIGSYKPEIHDIIKYGKAWGLEGEHQTLLCGTIGFHGGNQCIMVTGASQAGKTKVSNLVVTMPVLKAIDPDKIAEDRDLMLDDGGILSLEFGSSKALAYAEEKLGKAEQLYVPEYQKLIEDGNKLVGEILKAFGENRNAYRDVTNMKKKNNDTQFLKKSNWWSNIATENPLKIDVETGNRVMPLHIDVSAEQTKRIMLSKARREFISGRQTVMPNEEMVQFKHFIRKYRDEKEITFENPFAEYIADRYLPYKYIKSRRAIDFYLSFNRAICKWHYLNGNRVVANGNVIVNIEDIYQTEEVYGTKCRFDMLQLDPNSMVIFKIFKNYQMICEGKWAKDKLGDKIRKKTVRNDDGRVILDISTIHKEMTEEGLNLKLNVVEDMLHELQECGYLEYDTGTKSRNSKFMVVDTEKPVHSVIDYQEVFEHGKSLVEKWMPEVYDEWYTMNKTLEARDPYTGEMVDLTELEVRKVDPEPVVKENPIKTKPKTGLEKFM